jgi:hypothetical protein
MRRYIATAAVVAIGIFAATVPAFAGGGGGGGGQQVSATIGFAAGNSFATTASGTSMSGPVNFNVTRSTTSNKYTIYVVNQCWDASGALVVNIGVSVIWGDASSLAGSTGGLATGGTHCSAYVAMSNKAISGTLSYNVS